MRNLTRSWNQCHSTDGATLSPRRKLYAQRFLTYVCWHGRKCLLTSATYDQLRVEQQLDRFSVNQAIDDLYALGLIDERMAGETQVVIALTHTLDGAA